METVLITGASRGIGRETAKLFSKNGFNVVINYNKSEKDALELLSEIKNAAAIRADVSNRKEVFEMVEKANSIFGGIDILVNNAAVAGQMLFQDISEEEWNRIFDTNVKGAFNCTQAVLPNMLNKKSGKIINISSIWGITGASCEVHYSASKAALIGFTKALAKELGPSGITVNCVAPGVINTDMNSSIPKEVMDALKEETPLGKIGSPEDIANTIFFLASKKADFITGQVISPNGGFLI
ncbi:MAG: short-chain dehydrogenase/reductase [Oscillospiraceae bacterium]|jgi:3-oxoacyl-[acyl-carrier protein] reductase|nr:short-chain dehydrogenase/reductase [Oscillospiraceae bacterium]